MVLCIKFGVSLAVSLLAVSHTSLGGQTVGADHSGSKGEGKGSVVSLAGRGSGKKDQS